MGAFEIVMESRKLLVEQIIENMKKGYVFTKEVWDSQLLAPHNPLSQARYQGGNRIRLISAVVRNGYQDPRWMTVKQLRDKGYYVKKGEKQTICEKWIFTEEKVVQDENGEKRKEIHILDKPIVRYFGVFNAEQVNEFPPFSKEEAFSDVMQIGKDCMKASECKIIECAQPEAYYSPGLDRIVLPIHQMFKSEESYIATGLHEMVHSTGHKSRLNRDIGHSFGTPEYAKEELRAEIGSMFLKADLGISLAGEHFQDHSNYLKSWISVLENDYNELFRAAVDAEKAADRILGNYRTYRQTLGIEPEQTEVQPQKAATLAPGL